MFHNPQNNGFLSIFVTTFYLDFLNSDFAVLIIGIRPATHEIANDAIVNHFCVTSTISTLGASVTNLTTVTPSGIESSPTIIAQNDITAKT